MRRRLAVRFLAEPFIFRRGCIGIVAILHEQPAFGLFCLAHIGSADLQQIMVSLRQLAYKFLAHLLSAYGKKRLGGGTPDRE